MKKIKIYFKLILYIFFFFSISNVIYGKNFNKYYNSDKISKYFSGVVHLNHNEYEDSYNNLKELVGLEDNHFNYALLYQNSLINLEKFDEAYKYSKKIEKKKLNNFESDLIIGVYYLNNNKHERALEYFQKLNSKYQDGTFQNLLSVSLNNWVSFLNINKNDALRLNEKISRRFTNIKKIQKTLIHCFYDSEKTIENFEELTNDKNTNFLRYNFFYANYLRKIGKIDKAAVVVESSIKSSPRNLILNQLKIDLKSKKINNPYNNFDCKNLPHVAAEIFYIISNALSSQSAYELSNFYLNIAKYLNPKFISFEMLHAENFYMIDKLDRAKKIYNKSLNKGSIYNWHASKQIANILLEQNKKNKSIKFLKKAYNKISSPSIYETYDYAKFLKNNEEFEESIKYYTEVLNLIDKKNYLYPKATDGRGIAYERIGEWEKAEKDLLNSLSASPDQAYVINYLAYSWIEKGIYIEKSLEMLKKANQLKKNDGYIIDSLGWALFKLKRYEEAKKYLQLAVRIMPSDPIVNDHYGDSLWMNYQNIQARYYWNYVLNLEKTDEKLKESLKQKIIFGLETKL
tara:strand:- start:487 stop:2202 length:1716 start_codon:yes stop_codon:yes gene_type:complete